MSQNIDDPSNQLVNRPAPSLFCIFLPSKEGSTWHEVTQTLLADVGLTLAWCVPGQHTRKSDASTSSPFLINLAILQISLLR